MSKGAGHQGMEERRQSPRRAEEPVPFALEPLPAPAGVVYLRLGGELDLAVAGRVRSALDPGLEGGATAVVLDVADVVFMDSSMLKELLRARARLAERGGVIVLAAAGPSVRRLLSVTRTDELLGLADSPEEALERVSGT